MSSPEMPAIDITDLVRRYGRTEAVNGLTLRVPAGQCYGLFGRNGAGKTTTIKCLLNLLRPTSGSVRVFGLDPVQLGSTARTGTGQWIGEFIATFGLIATILGCVRFRPDALAPAVGLYITSAYWFTSSTSFANPAVTVARALSDTFAGIAPADAPGFIVAELLGAVAAAYLFGWLFAEDARGLDRAGARPRRRA